MYAYTPKKVVIIIWVDANLKIEVIKTSLKKCESVKSKSTSIVTSSHELIKNKYFPALCCLW